MTIQRDAQEAWEGVAADMRDKREAERLAALRLEARKANAADAFATWANDNFFATENRDDDTEGPTA